MRARFIASTCPQKEDRVNRRMTAGLAVLALATAGGAGIAAASGGSGSLDAGKNLLPQAKITQQQAEHAAQSAASGSLNETDLEHYEGTLVYNVDVGSKDVKVDASTGKVLAVNADD
jgi:uncharacterized membrane protein YkoI